MERVNILCAYGDINGYSAWTREKSHSSEYQAMLILQYYRMIKECFPRSAFYLKIIGDGFLVIREMEPQLLLSEQVSDFSKLVCQAAKRISFLIKTSHTPTPDGFRIRWGMDYVEKFTNGDFSKYEFDFPEYAGEVLNHTDEMLRFKVDRLCVCTTQIAAIVATIKSFRLERLSKHHWGVELC